MTPISPSHLGNYRLDELLGRGGMGEVFLAWDAKLERQVAIKRILPDPPPDATARQRFQHEARAVARLNHPAIVQVFELFETADGDDCLAMEYIAGHGLAEWIQERPLDLDDTLRLAEEIADGLAEAHAKGLIHRDLKLENIRLATTTQGPPRAKILDFGLARLLWNDALEGESIEQAVTRSGALVGTVHAMSPEQASGRSVDHRSDLFAFGSLLYEMLSGQAPFRGHNLLDTLRRITGEEPRPVAELRPGLPLDLLDLVQRLLAKEPAQRPQNARLVADTLAAARAHLASDLDSASGSAITVIASPSPPSDGDGMMDRPTGELPSPNPQTPIETAIRALVRTDLITKPHWIESLGDVRAAEVLARHDRMARDLLTRHGGLEIDKNDGFLLLFERPFSAVAYALAYHRSLSDLAVEIDVGLEARVGLHLGEIALRQNSPQDISRGAKMWEVEGLARLMAARLADLATAHQTLLTHSAFDLARRASVDNNRWDETLCWLAHGSYLFQGLDEAVEIYEVGVQDVAPLTAPRDTPDAHRTVSVSAEALLGWRPALHQAIPRRSKWTLRERLGEGGFGEVWLAEHPSGEQRVFKFCFEASRLRALKREVTLFRLLKETLGHRHDIARVLDWNFDAPPFFLEAEHTEGGDLVTWAAQQDGLAVLPLASRIELVAQIADALAAAHSVGVLHKDIKPENVLITHTVDGRPRIRLTDFGIATLLDPSQLDRQEVTALGFTHTLTEESSAAGSRRYLAPELLEGRPASVQADLYSLGVVLYQMAVADFSRALAPGWRRGIEDELLSHDIALLVDGSPERRPAGARDVARSLRRLQERRVARNAERLRERRQHRLRIAAVVGAVLLIMVSGLLLQAHFARQEAGRLQARAEQARQEAEGLIGFMLGDLQRELQSIGRLGALEGAGEKALNYFAKLEGEDRNPQTVAQHAKALHQMGDVKMAQGDLPGALQLFERSLASSQELRQRRPEDDSALFELGQSHFWVGNVFFRQRRFSEALEQMIIYLQLSEQLHRRQPDHDDWLLEVAYGHNNVGAAYHRLGNRPMARQHFEKALTISTQLLDRDPTHRGRRSRWVKAQLRLVQAQTADGELADALLRALEALDNARSLYEENPTEANIVRQLSKVRAHVSFLALNLGHLDLALEHALDQVALLTSLIEVDAEHDEWRRELEAAHTLIAQIYFFLGESDSASHFNDKIIAHAEGHVAHGKDTHWVIRSLIHALRLQAEMQLNDGNLDAALKSAQRAEVLSRRPEQEDSWDRRVEARLVLGRVLAAQGQQSPAENIWRLALEDVEAAAKNPRDVIWLDLRAQALLHLGRLDEASTSVFTLLGMGFAHPRFLDLCKQRGHGLCQRSSMTEVVHDTVHREPPGLSRPPNTKEYDYDTQRSDP